MIAVTVTLSGALLVRVRSHSRSHAGHGGDPAEVEEAVREQLYGGRGMKVTPAGAQAEAAGTGTSSELAA